MVTPVYTPGLLSFKKGSESLKSLDQKYELRSQLNFYFSEYLVYKCVRKLRFVIFENQWL